MDRTTDWSAGWSSGVRQGRVAPPKLILWRIPAGIRPSAQSRTDRSTRSGSCPATRRNESFSWAEDGMIVLPPGPW